MRQEEPRSIPWGGLVLALLIALVAQCFLWPLTAREHFKLHGASADALAGLEGAPPSSPEPGWMQAVRHGDGTLIVLQGLANLACLVAAGVWGRQRAGRQAVERGFLVVAGLGVGLALVQGVSGSGALWGTLVSAGGSLLARWCLLPLPERELE